MNDVLVISVDKATTIENCERFFTEPKIGNLKDPVKIQAKIQESYSKQAEEASSNSLFAVPLVVSACLIQRPKEEEEGMKVAMDQVSKVGEVNTFENELEPLGVFLKGLQDVGLIIGPHPTTHSRIIQNAFLRHGIAMPKCFGFSVTRLNVFHLLCNTQEGEYPGCLAPLGIKTANPVEDTIKVASLLGII